MFYTYDYITPYRVLSQETIVKTYPDGYNSIPGYNECHRSGIILVGFRIRDAILPLYLHPEGFIIPCGLDLFRETTCDGPPNSFVCSIFYRENTFVTGFGTIINSAGIVAGGIAGLFSGKLFTLQQQESLNKANGISVLFIGIAGAMEGMLQIQDSALSSGKSMLVVLCLALGTMIGEWLGIENAFERFGEWLKRKTGNSNDAGFVDAFVTASLTVSIGAMAVVGAIQDGLLGDYSTLAVKTVLDAIIIAVMTSSMGKGAIFSAIPVFAFEGCMTLLAKLISPLMTATAIAYLSLIGSTLIFCVGVNLVWGKKLRVANMLPAMLLAILAAYLPWNF